MAGNNAKNGRCRGRIGTYRNLDTQYDIGTSL